MRRLWLIWFLAAVMGLSTVAPLHADGLFPVELTGVGRVATTGDGRLLADIQGVGLGRETRVSLVRAFGNNGLVRSRLQLFSTVEDMAQSGHLLYLANNLDGLVVVDVSRPDQPQVLGSLALPGRAMRILLRQGLALVLSVRQGLHLVDISVPDSPHLIRTLPLEDVSYDMVANDRYLYISSPRQGIRIFRLTGGDLEFVTTFQPGADTWELELNGDVLAAVHGRKGMAGYRVDGSGRLHRAFRVELPDFCRQVGVLGPDLYVVRGQRNLFVVNTSSPGKPAVDIYRDMVAGGSGVLRRGDVLCWGGYKGLFIASIASTGELLAPGMVVVSSGVRSLLADREFLWVADQKNGLTALDLRADLSVADRSLFHLGGRAMDMAVEDGWIYLTGNDFDLQVVRVKKRGRLLPAGRMVDRLAIASAATDGDILCLGAADGELLFVDVSQTPVVRRRLTLPGRPHELVLEKNSLFVAAGDAGVLHYRLAADGQAALVGALSTPHAVVDLARREGQLVAIESTGEVVGVAVGSGGGLKKVWSRSVGARLVEVELLAGRLFLVTADGRVLTSRLGTGGAPAETLKPMQFLGPVRQLAGDQRQLLVRLRNGDLYRYRLQRQGGRLVLQAPELVSRHVDSIRLQPQGLVLVQSTGRIRVRDPNPDAAFRTLVELDNPEAGKKALWVKDFILSYDGRRFVAFWPLSGDGGEPASFGGQGKALAVKDHIVALANLSQLRLIDVTVPDAPAELARLSLPGMVQDVAWIGQKVACYIRDFGVVLVDCSVPAKPVVRGRFPADGLGLVAPVEGNRLLVASAQQGVFRLLDTSSPDAPALLDELRLIPPADEISRPADVLVRGDIAYVADHALGLLVLKIAADGHLTLVGSHGVRGSPFALSLAGNRLFLSNWNLGVMEFDISMPARPALVALVPGTDGCRHLQVSDGRLIVHDDKLRAVSSQPIPIPGRILANDGDIVRIETRIPEDPGRYLLFAADDRSWDTFPLIEVDRNGLVRLAD